MDNATEAAVVPGLDVQGCKNLSEVVDFLNSLDEHEPVHLG